MSARTETRHKAKRGGFRWRSKMGGVEGGWKRREREVEQEASGRGAEGEMERREGEKKAHSVSSL